jgi:hypothetical protein
MIQTSLLPETTDKKRWQPFLPPYRPQRFPRTMTIKPLPGQLFLPGMEPNDEPRPRIREQAPGIVEPAICPNCGGTEFDEDGDCTSCWEPAVVKPSGRKTRATGRR